MRKFMSDTIKEQVYAMKTPEILSKAKGILKEAEYRKELRNIFGNMNMNID